MKCFCSGVLSKFLNKPLFSCLHSNVALTCMTGDVVQFKTLTLKWSKWHHHSVETLYAHMSNTALHPANIINNQSNTHAHIFICHVLLMQQLETDHVMCIKFKINCLLVNWWPVKGLPCLLFYDISIHRQPSPQSTLYCKVKNLQYNNGNCWSRHKIWSRVFWRVKKLETLETY